MRTHLTPNRFKATLTFTLLLCSTACAQATFQGLVDLPGGSSGSAGGAYAISADGTVVVGDGVTTNGSEACLWIEGAPSSIGDLPGGVVGSRALAVSANGSVIVGYGRPGGGDFEAFRWEDGIMTGLGDVQGGIPNSRAAAVSADGLIVAGTAYSQSGGQAFRWENGIMASLGNAPGAPPGTQAAAISADGTTIVGRAGIGTPGTNDDVPFVWRNGTMTALPAGIGTCGGGGDALAVTHDGTTVFGFNCVDGTSETALFAWTSEGGPLSLGSVPQVAFCGGQRGLAVSADASRIVGGCDTGAAFIWDADGGVRLLRDVLTGEYGLNLSSWMLYRATGISADGGTIVGLGSSTEVGYNAWIATLPTHPQGDADADGVVDDLDLCPDTILEAPVDGQGCPPIANGDIDRDGDVDLVDFAALQACMSGAHQPADSDCGE